MKLAPGFKTIWMDGREYIIAQPGSTYTVKEEERMSQIDWSKEPQDATHCWPFAPEFFMRIDGEWHVWYMNAQKWMPASITCRLPELVERPSTQWNGAGLPPVGVVCEFMWNYIREGSEYVQVRVLVHDGESAILRVVDGDNSGKLRESRGGDCGGHPMFRKIRTPEQIAAEEREAAIDELIEFFVNYYGNPKGSEQYMLICRSLHDAGYRKQST